MKNKYKKYTAYSFFIISTGLLLVLLINSLVDTLWYFGGNKLFAENYSFNERLSKLNQYLVEPGRFDCIVFGSSRVTMLDVRNIENNSCFNFSFSDGNPREFVYYAEYIKKYGRLPDKLIIGIDARFFSRQHINFNVPDVVKKLHRPANFIRPYLSFDVLDFTIRTLQKKPPKRRYYTDELIGDILPGTADYNPPPCFTPDGFGEPYTNKNINYISRIKRILQAKSVIGYVAPISAWDMLLLIEDGELDSYISLIYELSKEFDQFYDFSVPSIMTARTDNNFDGHHFSRQANNKIAEVLNGRASEPGLPLHELSYKEYKRIFTAEMLNFSKRTGKRQPASWSCPHRSAIR